MYFFSRRLPLHLLAQCNYLTHSSLALLHPYENKKSKQKISTYLLHMKIKQVTVFPHFSFAKMMGRRKIKAIFTLSWIDFRANTKTLSGTIRKTHL